MSSAISCGFALAFSPYTCWPSGSLLVVCVAQFLCNLCQLAMCAAGVHNGRALVLGCSGVPWRTNTSLRKHQEPRTRTQLVEFVASDMYPQPLRQRIYGCSSSCTDSACHQRSNLFLVPTGAVCCAKILSAHQCCPTSSAVQRCASCCLVLRACGKNPSPVFSLIAAPAAACSHKGPTHSQQLLVCLRQLLQHSAK